MNTTSKKLSTFDRLVSEDVSSEAVKKALEQHKQKQQERDTERVRMALEVYDQRIQSAVDHIRSARRAEKAAKETIEKLGAALEAFKKDGNIEAFRLVIR